MASSAKCIVVAWLRVRTSECYRRIAYLVPWHEALLLRMQTFALVRTLGEAGTRRPVLPKDHNTAKLSDESHIRYTPMQYRISLSVAHATGSS